MTLFSFHSSRTTTIPLPDYKLLPKLELHLHLDSSLSFEAVKKIRPDITKPQFRKLFVAPPKCKNLPDYLSRVSNQVDILQTKDSLKIASETLLQQLAADNIAYAEVRFAPLLHTREGLSAEKVLEIVTDIFIKQAASKHHGPEVRIIVCSLRNFSEKKSTQSAELAVAFKDRGVVGFDLAGDEKGFPLDNHIRAYQLAGKHDISRTAHAGEAAGPESVWDTIKKLKPTRIGHGVRSYEDPELIDFIKRERIHLEVCPTSNIQTDVYDSYSDHTIDKLYEEGISVSINTDGRTTSNVSLADEYRKLNRIFGWDEEHFLQCNLNALDAAFIPEDKKQKIKSIIEAGY